MHANDRMMDAHEAGEYLNVKPATLGQWRYSGRGPKYSKLNGLIRYKLKDLMDYIRKNERNTDA